MKACLICEDPKVEEEFPWRNRAAGVRQNTCKLCTRNRSKVWYQGNKARHLENGKGSRRRWRVKRIAERQALVDGLKDVPCKDCFCKYSPWVMQFDHLDGAQKVDNIATMVHAIRPIAAILEEAAKCEVVCANCHAERTHQRRMK